MTDNDISHLPVAHGEYGGVGDGETTTFSWETGVPDPDDIQYASLRPIFEPSTPDHYHFIDGTRIGSEYASPPAAGEEFSVEWAVNASLPPRSEHADQETNAVRSILDWLKRWLHF